MEESKLRSFTVNHEDFENKGVFIAFCARNWVNGDYSLLWDLFYFQDYITLYTPFTENPLRWED